MQSIRQNRRNDYRQLLGEFKKHRLPTKKPGLKGGFLYSEIEIKGEGKKTRAGEEKFKAGDNKYRKTVGEKCINNYQRKQWLWLLTGEIKTPTPYCCLRCLKALK